MSVLFIVRNPLSQLVAKDICNQEKIGSAHIRYDLDKMPSDIWIAGESISLIEKGLWRRGWSSLVDRANVKKFFLINSITRIYVTYPLHFRASFYVNLAKKLGVKVYYFEEGTCFYRASTSNEYDINTIKGGVKSVLAKLWGLEEGYKVTKPDGYYALLRNSYGAQQLRHISSSTGGGIEFLYLSRPLELDYTDITIDDQVNSLVYLLKTLPGEAKLFIKFHPRDSKEKKEIVMNSVGNRAEELLDSRAAESIVEGMDGGAVYAFETATLAYTNMLSEGVKAYSLLPLLMNKDKTGMLSSYYEDYSREYPWIEFIY